jgi:hypothetical protein
MWYCDNPLEEALIAITGKKPPFDLRKIKRSGELEEALAIALTDWCSLNANPCWATGTSILEAANLLVERALENGNLRDD